MAVAESSDASLLGKAGKKKVLWGFEAVDCTDCENAHVCIVFGTKLSQKKHPFQDRLKKTLFTLYGQNFRDKLKRVFRSDSVWEKFSREKFPKKEDELKEMTFLEYSNMFRKHFLVFLEEHGFKLSARKRKDDDEVLLTIELPTDRKNVPCYENKELSAAECLAAKLGFRQQLNDGDQKAPGGLPLPAFQRVTVKLAGDKKFRPFVSRDLIRIIEGILRQSFNLDEMKDQQLINHIFPIHSTGIRDEVAEKTSLSTFLPTSFKAFVTYPYAMFPSDANEKLDPKAPSFAQADWICDYFGEEVAFLFGFIVMNSRLMLFPAVGGCVMIFRVFAGSIALQRVIQTGFAFVVSIWAAWHCQALVRREHAWTYHWGARAEDQGAVAVVKVASWDRNLDTFQRGHICGWMRVQLWKFLGSVSMIAMLVAVIVGIGIIQYIRKDMLRHPNGTFGQFAYFLFFPLHSLVRKLLNSTEPENGAETAAEMGSSLGALLITVQIRIFDFVWDMFARYAVKQENHRTYRDLSDALVYKLFAVKLFNLMYPFMYIAFIKEWAEGGCKVEGQSGCIVELQQTLAMLFVSNATIDVIFAGISWLKCICTLKAEQKEASGCITFLMVQRSMEEPWDVLDDMLVFVSQFVFVCCFTIAWPFLPVAALIYNFFMSKVYMLRRIFLQQRNFPHCADSGVWKDIMKACNFFSVFVNTGLAVFAMRPIKDLPIIERAACFIGIEHGLAAVITIMYFVVSAEDVRLKACDECNRAFAESVAYENETDETETRMLPPELREKGLVAPNALACE
eukprot:TRINITY_DN19207_c0_g1_i1.p1 TRINITY_DN19207_c0_g1~~TRINITY_DN19207_c0_g1_i1.p1  ORF type:complete len:805 (-),score=131.38 TRINITY_DN19207_c0_g1_i1:111-2483(-)